ncbi:MAG: BrnT family toxin [Gammaproteobacteria bacterium]|jgi:hypothetical protein|nr:BrnT family toxin [Gammaproteobacteria bacterium]
MHYEWDENKRQINRETHDVDFIDAEGFDWTEAQIRIDFRNHDQELRLIAYGPIGNRLHVMVSTLRAQLIRIISLRKANRREVKRYVENKAHHPH